MKEVEAHRKETWTAIFPEELFKVLMSHINLKKVNFSEVPITANMSLDVQTRTQFHNG